jgi:hypothetical protein
VSDSDDSDKTSTTVSLCIDENENRLVYPYIDANRAYQSTVHWHDSAQHTDDSELDEFDAESGEKILGEGSEEDDSLLVIYQE